MLILRMGESTLHDDGLIEAPALGSVQALSAAWDLLETEQREREADARLRCRVARRRAIRRGHRAGLALATRRHVALSTALARASAGLQDALMARVDERISSLLSASGPAQWLQPELQRCLQAAAPQPLVSIRVCAEHLPRVRAWLLEAGLDHHALAHLQVMADASLSRTCCVVETTTGIVRGAFTSQLYAVRRGLVEGAREQLADLCARWPELP
ncbi:MAG TPA: hypothetical protein VM687_04110 [Stenotrophomonas sp.]|nr:hypothetical protein [Stenotrophomonas sp.]